MDKDKVIELADKRKQNKKGIKGPKDIPNANRINMYKRLAREAVAEGAFQRLPDADKSFVDLVVSGSSLLEAYKQSYPDICFREELNDKGETTGLAQVLTDEQIYSRAHAMTRKVDVRSSITIRLSEERDAVSHTADRLDNFIVKRLEAEAANPLNSAASRIAALKALSEHQVVKVAEGKSADKAKATSDEVLEAIQAKVKSLTSGNSTL